VDDAIVDVENVYKRLRENKRSPNPKAAVTIIRDACLEVRSAVVYATFAVILIVLPVLSLSGIAGALFAPLGIAYVSAVLASLVVALTVTPALSALLVAGGKLKSREPPLMRWSKERYRSLLQGLAHRPRGPNQSPQTQLEYHFHSVVGD